jgi:hypothetical protein
MTEQPAATTMESEPAGTLSWSETVFMVAALVWPSQKPPLLWR